MSAERAVRFSTLVWGLVVMAFAGVFLAGALGASVDGVVVAVGVLVGAGVLLLVGAVVAGVRGRPMGSDGTDGTDSTDETGGVCAGTAPNG